MTVLDHDESFGVKVHIYFAFCLGTEAQLSLTGFNMNETDEIIYEAIGDAIQITDGIIHMVKAMQLSYSYKPVFLLSFLKNMNETGGAKLEDVARDFAA